MKISKSILVTIILFILILVFSLPYRLKKYNYIDGTYIGVGSGQHDNIEVAVTIEGGKIYRIDILAEDETPELREIVYENIPKRVIKANTPDVNVVAGATYTSKGLLEAIENAVDKARIEE